MKLEFFPIHHIPEISSGMPLGEILRKGAAASGIEIGLGDVMAVAQKVVSKAEGRMVNLEDVKPSPKAASMARLTGKDPRLLEVILRESRRIVRSRGDVLICETHHGFICANAGIDRSNVDGGSAVTLLPKNPDASARNLAADIGCGVLITDTFGRAWREGLVDVTIGMAGVAPFIDYRGASDRHGYSLQATVLAAADALSAAAGLVMEKNSAIPAVLIRGFQSQATTGGTSALLRAPHQDLFL